VELDVMLYRDDDIEDNLDSILLNPVVSTISKWRTLKFLRWGKFEPIGEFGLNFLWMGWH
jgi:hypothetical protein